MKHKAGRKDGFYWIILYVVLTLALSWSLLAWIFADPQRLSHFDWMMFIPAIVAIVLNLARRRSLKEMLLAPVSTASLVFSVLYPLGFIALTGLATWGAGLSVWHPAGAVNYPLVPPLMSLVNFRLSLLPEFR